MHLAILNNKHCSVAEAATIIGCTEGRVRQLLRSQEMRGIKVNERAWLVEVKDAERVRDTENAVGAPRGKRS
jgi:hypothetical protein